MKTYWGVEVYLHTFLTSALDGGEWSASHPGRFTPRERAPCAHWIGGWVGSRTVLDAVAKRKIPSPRRESKPITPKGKGNRWYDDDDKSIMPSLNLRLKARIKLQRG
jgi:hypothetical protein